MKTVLKMLAICMMAGGLGVQSVYAEPLVIQEQGSFSAGGTIITAPGTFDAKKPLDSAGQTYHGDHASVFYQIPENPHKYPIVMLHGAGQSSRTWESTPDGREGFQNKKISIIRQQGTFGRKTCAGQQRMHTTSGSFG